MSLVDLRQRVSRFLKEAALRIDGIAMYVVASLFALAAAALALGYGDFGDAYRSKLLWGSIFMIPVTFLLFLQLAMFSSATPGSRIFNAVLLLALPLFLWWVAT